MKDLPEEYTQAVTKCSSLAYLWNRIDGQPYTLKKDLRATTHGMLAKDGSLLSCCLGSTELPAGTEGWLFVSKKLSYSSYVWVGDQQYPAKGADVLCTGSYYTFLTFTDLNGHRVLASGFSSTEHEPRKIGTV